ncbi:hypothetical protein BOX15_Mlig000061g1 [Macrostomum lignano]|uniref:KASH domain-containing protein n=1 Tax=Macrostomum lignano TaxID=282301 RepID=A0A267F955_9PLAT|nr:hypothetical protein BOX15_Mlig000061g1 [Macrostomum lignano]
MTGAERSHCVILLQQQEGEFRIHLSAISYARRLLDKLADPCQLTESLELQVQRHIIRTEKLKSRLYELWLQLLELKYSLDSEFLASRRRSRSRLLLVSVDHLNSVFPPGWAGPESGFASERSPSNIASNSAGHSCAGDAVDANVGVGGGFGGNGSSRESACGDSLSSCDILPFSEDEYEKIQDNSSSALSSAVYAAKSKTTTATAAGMTDGAEASGAASVLQRPAECGKAAGDARRAALARQVDQWRQDASLRHDLCSRSDSRLRNGFVACRVRSHDTLLRRMRISANANSEDSASANNAKDNYETLLTLITRDEGGDRLEFFGGDGDTDFDMDNVEGVENGDSKATRRQTKLPRSLAEVQVRHSRSAYLSTASNYFYGMTAVDNDVVHDDIDGEVEGGEDNVMNQDASVSASHWNGDGVSDVDLSAISQQGGSCPIRLALAQARIAAAGSVGSSFGSGTGRYRGGTSGGRWRDFRSDTRLYWECLAGGSEAYSEGDGSGSAGVDGGDGGRIGRRGRDATSSDVDESWSFSRSDLSSSAGSYGLELPDNRGGAVESGARISCDSLEGGMHPHPGGSAAQEAVSSDHSLLLVDRADRHLYWQHRSDLHPEAAATAFDSTDGAATASNMPTVGEEDQSGLDESSLSSVANEQLDVDQLWDYSCQPDLYSDADDTDELDEQRTQAALLLEDSQLSLWEIDQPAMDLTSAGLLPPQLPASAVRRRKIAAELLETEHDFLTLQSEVCSASKTGTDLNLGDVADLIDASDDDVIDADSAERWRRHAEIQEAASEAHASCLATGEFDASAADMAAGVERLDRLADDLRRWLATGAAELEELRQAEGESRQRRLLMENWELLIGWLQSDLDSCQSNRESLSRAHASMLELERLLCRCERLIQEELHRLRQLESASSFDRETAAADLEEAAKNADSAASLVSHCSALLDASLGASLTASAHARIDERLASASSSSARLRRRCRRLRLLVIRATTCTELPTQPEVRAERLGRRWCARMAAAAAVASLLLLLLLLLCWLAALLANPAGAPPASAAPVTADWGCRRGWMGWLVSRLLPALRETRPNGAPF